MRTEPTKCWKSVGSVGSIPSTRALKCPLQLARSAEMAPTMDREQLFARLDEFKIETPSWGYADTGTRFGKFLQPAAASTIEEKLADAGIVHKFTGCCPSVAVHVLWDFSIGVDAADTANSRRSTACASARSTPTSSRTRSTNSARCAAPMSMRTQPCASSRDGLHQHRQGGAKSNLLSLWFADGTNYPGQDDIAERKHRMHGALRQWHDAMPQGMTMLVEYKPFEPAFYHTDIADWGMAYVFAKAAGPQRESARRHRPSLARRRTSSTSSRSCSMRTCSAASTSTTANTPTMI